MNNKRINVGLLGCGTVGSGVFDIIQNEHDRILESTGVDISIKKVLVRDIAKKRNVPSGLIAKNKEEILNDPEISVVVELTSGDEEISERLILEALDSGKHVVTAGKAAVAKYMGKIKEKAIEKKKVVLFEGAVGGVIPIIALLDYLASNSIVEITGIINGTTNYILTKMNEGMDYETALKLAQDKGFAEVPPDLDVLGFDAASKISILASEAFNVCIDPSAVYTEGITKITKADFRFASERGYAIKLLATAKKQGNSIDVRVHPALTKDPILSNVNEAMNAIKVVGNYSGPITLVGQGAGKFPTATAVINDIVSIANNNEPKRMLQNVFSINGKDFPSKGYFRVMLKHSPGSLSVASGIIGDCGINIAETSQYRDMFQEDTNSMPWFFVTEPSSHFQIMDAIKRLEECDRVVEKPFYMRVE